jgi:hypothetical protein
MSELKNAEKNKESMQGRITELEQRLSDKEKRL